MKLPPEDSELGRLMANLPRAGRVEWIGLRPKRDVAMIEVGQAEAVPGKDWWATAMRVAAAIAASR